jgi:hypothetical protein
MEIDLLQDKKGTLAKNPNHLTNYKLFYANWSRYIL